jgi:hypothetical protein
MTALGPTEGTMRATVSATGSARESAAPSFALTAPVLGFFVVTLDAVVVNPAECVNPIWPHCAGLIWPHPRVGGRAGRRR